MKPTIEQAPFFVGRAEAIEQFEQLARQSSPTVIGDLKGPYGIGKTTVLHKLREKLSQAYAAQNLRVAWVELSEYELPPRPSSDSEAKLKWLLRAHMLYRDLLSTLGQALLPDAERQAFEEHLRNVYKPSAYGSTATIRNFVQQEIKDLATQTGIFFATSDKPLHRIIDDRMDFGEIRSLCADLGVDYQNLPGESKADLARELVRYMARRESLPKLVERCRRLRPDVDWGAVPAASATAETGLPALLRDPDANMLDLFERAITRAHQQATEVFADRISSLTQSGPVFVFLDDYCHIEGSPTEESLIETWILHDLIPALKNCKVVLGRTDYDHPIAPYRDKITLLPIRPFTQDESRTYVAHRLGDESLTLGWDERVYQYCEGHPLFTAMMVNVIRANWPRKLPTPPAQFLVQVPKGEGEQIKQLADALVTTTAKTQPLLSEAIDIACILREFDRDAIEYILCQPNASDKRNPWWERLISQPMIRPKQDDYAVHEFFAEFRYRQLQERDQAQHQDYVNRIHAKVAEFYGELRQKSEDEREETTWQRLHYYECPEWQHWTRHWLFHTIHSPSGGLELAARYFDAFFWWGEYVRFPFCDQLLRDLEYTELPPSARDWFGLIQSFHRIYPPARSRTTDTTWVIKVREILKEIKKKTDPRRAAPGSDELALRWHITALIDNYLGEAFLAQNPPQYAKAEAAYQDSIKALTQAEKIYRQQLEGLAPGPSQSQAIADRADNEVWTRGWMYVWLAGLYTRQGDYDQASKMARKAEKEIIKADDTDQEALARVHLSRGAAHFNLGQWDKALNEYSLYALRALRFLVQENERGGDYYALEFFREMIENIARRLIELEGRDPALAAQWWDGLIEFWGPEGQPILPPDVGTIPSPLAQAVEQDERGHVLSHCLPLPLVRLDTWPQSAYDGPWNIPPDQFDHLQYAANALTERHLE